MNILDTFPNPNDKELDFLESLTLNGTSEEFPADVQMQNDETLDDYSQFLYYLFLGQKRTLVAVANRFRPDNMMPFGADGKRENAIALNLAAGRGAHTVSQLYIKTCGFARQHRWQERARSWDTYLGRVMMQQMGHAVINGAISAIEVLVNEQVNAKKASVRVLAAKTLLGHAMPKNVNHTFEGEVNVTVKELSDAALSKIAVARPSLPAPTYNVPMLSRKTDEEEVIEGDSFLLTQEDDSQHQFASEDLQRFIDSFKPFVDATNEVEIHGD